MALWWDRGQVIDDSQEGVRVPEGATRVNMFRNEPQYGGQEFGWDPANRYFSGNIQSNAPGYLPEMFARLDRQRSGQLRPWEADELAQWEATARAMPTRDIGSLTAGWQGDMADERAAQEWWSRLDPGSPDAGGVMLALRDKAQAGTATPQERALYEQVRGMAQDWDYRASAPQASDANPFGLGDNLFGALFTIGLGASGGLAAAPLAAGGAGLSTTLGSLGTLAGTAGSIGNLVAPAIDADWFSRLTQGLGAAGGIAGGVGGLANLWGTGIQGLGDAARLASSAGRITSGLGTLSGSDVLRQGGGYLGAAGGLGSGANTLADVFGGGVSDLTDAARLASGLGQVGGAVGQFTGNQPLRQASSLLGLGGRLGGGVQGLLGAAGQAQQRGTGPVPRTMGDQDWLRWQGNQGPWQQNATPVLWNL